MRARWSGWLVAGALLLARPARAETPFEAKVRKACSDGRADLLVTLVSGAEFSEASRDAASLETLCRYVEVTWARLSHRRPGEAGQVFDVLADAAATRREAAPEVGAAQAAWAQATAARARHRIRLGEKEDPAALAKAAETYVGAYVNAAPLPEAAHAVAGWLAAAAEAKPAESPKWLARAEAILQSSLPAGTPLPVSDRAILLLWRARAALAAKAKPEAKKHVEAGIALLAEAVAAKQPDVALATTHAALVGLSGQHGLGVKAEFRTVPALTTEKRLRFEIPLSKAWSYFDAPTGNMILGINHRAPDGDLIRWLNVFGFDATARVRTGEAESTAVPASDPKALAEGYLTGLPEIERLTDVRPAKKVRRVRLSKHVPEAWLAEVVGLDSLGAFRRVRVWIFHVEEGRTYEVRSMENWDVGIDGEFESVLASIRPNKK